MNDEQRAKAHKILEHYGESKEQLKTIEELGELIAAIVETDVKSILEEMADVMICLEHLAYMHNITQEELKEEIDYKLNRQIRRMQNE